MEVENFDEKFRDLKNFKCQIEIIIRSITEKTEELKDIYKKYIDNMNFLNDDKTSLDSFNHQLNLILSEKDNYQNILNLFLNRMYGEYYNLYKNIIKFIKPLTDNEMINIECKKNYPIYKILETDILYEFDYTEHLNTEISNIIDKLFYYINSEKEDLKIDVNKSEYGIHLNNFVQEKSYNINILDEKIKLFNSTLCNYKFFQIKFLKRLLLKLQILFYQLEYDININSIQKPKVENKAKNITDNFGEKNIFIDKSFEKYIFKKIRDLDNNIFFTNDNDEKEVIVHERKSSKIYQNIFLSTVGLYILIQTLCIFYKHCDVIPGKYFFTLK